VKDIAENLRSSERPGLDDWRRGDFGDSFIHGWLQARLLIHSP